MDEYTQLDDEEMEIYLRLQAEKREREKAAERDRKYRRECAGWGGGMVPKSRG